jgi:phosphinothricin acetyltransferase
MTVTLSREPNVLIRDATEADLPFILAVYNDVIRTSAAIYTEIPATLADRQAWFAQRTGQGYPVLLAEDAGTRLGFATFGDFRPWPGFGHTVEHSVHVDVAARGRGVGGALVAALLPRAQRLDKHMMVAAIDAENAASIRLHERLGFIHAGLMREVGWKFGRWLDMVFMQRLLVGTPA